MSDASAGTLTRKDFVSDQEVRWCPGCGDYSILAQVQKVMPTLGIPPTDVAEPVHVHPELARIHEHVRDEALIPHLEEEERDVPILVKQVTVPFTEADDLTLRHGELIGLPQ